MRPLLPFALALSLVGLPAKALAQDAAAAAKSYVQSLQNEDGGFSPALPKAGGDRLPSSLRATSASMRALKYFGGNTPKREAACSFVSRCIDKQTGGFTDAPGGKADVATTAVGLMAAAELGLQLGEAQTNAVNYLVEHSKGFEDIRIAVAGLEAVKETPSKFTTWKDSVQFNRNADGTFGKGAGKTRETASAVVSLLRMGTSVGQSTAILIALREGQRADGGFGKEAGPSELETSYRVLRAFHMLKEKPAHPDKCKEFVMACRNPDGGFGVAPGQPSSAAGTYFAAIILHWLKAK